MTYLRRGRKASQFQLERGVRPCETQLWKRHSPAAHREDHSEAGCPPAAHGGPQWSRYPPAARGRDTTPEQVGMPKAGCDPVRSPCWSKLLIGPVTSWRERSPCWSRFAGRTCDPMWVQCWSHIFLKDCTLWKAPMLEQFVKNGSPWRRSWRTVSCGRDPTMEQEKSVRNALPEEEGASERTCDELTTTPIPHLPALLGRRR